MVFEGLRQAVNGTHGSLHQAFLAWDKSGSGELSKARLRVGLRACRGAQERDVEEFMRTIFEGRDTDKVTFSMLFQTFHEGDRRFHEDVKLTSKKQLSTAKGANDDDQILSERLAASVRISSPQRVQMRTELEAYHSPNRPRHLTEKKGAALNPPVERKLNFDESLVSPTTPEKANEGVITPSEPLRSTRPYSPSVSSARFQHLRQARSPSLAKGAAQSSPRASAHMIDLVEKRMFESRIRSPSFNPGTDSSRRSVSTENVFRPRPVSPSEHLKSPRLSSGRVNLNGKAITSAEQPRQTFQNRQYNGVEHPLVNVAEPSRSSRQRGGGFEEAEGSSESSLLDEYPAEADSSGSSLVLDVILRTDLRAMLLSMASHTAVVPAESLLTPSDLRRSIHAVDSSLSRAEVDVIARALMGGTSPQRVRLSKVLKALDVL